mmetsp:Transcript_20031/g.47706  ORF Transcript_20031/g.47706 Transcript_20031/m.47706 type:complete len:298 (-) Transcript_20031:635-1528(-)
MDTMVVVTSEEKSQSRPRYQTMRRKRPKHMVLFIVTAPYTWLKVREMFLIFFFLANCSDDTSSDALDAKGVTTNATKNAGTPDAFEKDDTESTMGSEMRATMKVPPTSSCAALPMICAGVIGSLLSSSSSSSSSAPPASSSTFAWPEERRGVESVAPPFASPDALCFLSSASHRRTPSFSSSKVILPSPSASNSWSMKTTSRSSSCAVGDFRFAWERTVIILRSSSPSMAPLLSESKRTKSSLNASSRTSPLESMSTEPAALAMLEAIWSAFARSSFLCAASAWRFWSSGQTTWKTQ